MNKFSFHTVTNYWGWSYRGIKNWIKYGWALFDSWGIETPSARCYKILFFVLKVTHDA